MMKRLALIVLVGVSSVAMPSCSALDTQESMTQARQMQQYLADEAAAKIAALEAQKAHVSPEQQAEIERLQAELARAAQSGNEAIEQGIALLTRAMTEDGEITPESAAPVVAAYLPWPWNLAAMLGIPLVVGGVQELRRRKAAAEMERAVEDARSIINAIDVARMQSPEVAAGMKAAKERMERQLTAEAKALIEAESIT